MASQPWTDDTKGYGPGGPRRALLTVAAVTGVVLGLAGCGGSDGAPSSAPDATGRGASTTSVVEVTVAESSPTTGVTTVTTVVPVTTAAPTTAAPTTAAPTTIPPTTVPPDVLQRQPGVAAIVVTASGADPTRPVFTWVPVGGATGYQLVVHGGDGSPLWAWTGVDTTVPLGGIERSTDQEGPTLTGPSTVRVYAFDASTRLVGISAWTPLAP